VNWPSETHCGCVAGALLGLRWLKTWAAVRAHLLAQNDHERGRSRPETGAQIDQEHRFLHWECIPEIFFQPDGKPLNPAMTR